MTYMEENAGKYALTHIHNGMNLGLGSGQSVYYLIKHLREAYDSGKLTDFTLVSGAKETADWIEAFGFTNSTIDDVDQVDIMFSGADQVTLNFDAIKGGRGSLFHEKILSLYSHKRIWLVSEDQVQDNLNRPLPVEVDKFGAWKLFKMFAQAGMDPSFRKAGSDILLATESDNYLIDLNLGIIPSPRQLAYDLSNLVGVVEDGLFIELAEMIIVGTQDGNIEEHHKRIVKENDL